MLLGNFSVSLAVKDLAVSLTFYEALGFAQVGGDAEQNWLIVQNGDAAIGLFQGMFDKNLLTFNPGWDKSCGQLPDGEWQDVRELQARCQAEGIPLQTPPIKSPAGPASFMVVDPDGNSILIDQHR
jgi:catechol 2,3-dioxygenase-like lactoylglutathione lyase family enzyme